jgi:ankyrin repeat protein
MAGNIESAEPLLAVGADPAGMWDNDLQPLHLATKNKQLEMMKLHDSVFRIDSAFVGFIESNDSESVLHHAYSIAHLDMTFGPGRESRMPRPSWHCEASRL